MSWATLDETTKARARQLLTQRQIDVLTLHLAGCSQRKTATMLGISRSTVRDHLQTAIACLKEDEAA